MLSAAEPRENNVPLVHCPECNRQVSTAAVSGHPLQGADTPSTGPKCYVCPAPATTRCQSCGTLSCAIHLQSIYVPHGRGGAYELRCGSCYASAETWKVIGWLVTAALFVVAAIVFLTMWR